MDLKQVAQQLIQQEPASTTEAAQPAANKGTDSQAKAPGLLPGSFLKHMLTVARGQNPGKGEALKYDDGLWGLDCVLCIPYCKTMYGLP